MKIEVLDDAKIVIYYSFIFDDILEYDVEDIKTFIQMLVLRLRKKYHLDLKGYYHLDVYVQKMLILEFEKIDDYEDEIDLNIVLHTKMPILVGFSDYFLISNRKKYVYQERYYVPIDEIDYEKYVEFVDIVYGKEASLILERGKIV